MEWVKTNNFLLLLFGFFLKSLFISHWISLVNYPFTTFAHFSIGLPVLCFNFVNVVIFLKVCWTVWWLRIQIWTRQPGSIGSVTSLRLLNLHTLFSSLVKTWLIMIYLKRLLWRLNKLIIINSMVLCLTLIKWSLR